MALAHFLVHAALPLLLFFSCAGEAASEVGVCYGTMANDLPDPASVAQMLKQNGITMVRIFDADPRVLASLANTGIKTMVSLPNENLTAAAADPSYALDWVQRNVAAYHPATTIHCVGVGNEVFYSRPELTPQLVPAMANVHEALATMGLAGAGVKVSSPLAFDMLKDPTFPPSAGRFRDEIAETVMKPMLEFLNRTGSYLTMNIYPFWAYATQPDDVSRDFALGNPNHPGVLDHNTGLRYYSLLDAERDAMHAAMDALGFPGVSLHVTETGYPSAGKSYSVDGVHLEDKNDGSSVFSKANAQAYSNNLINRVMSGNTGTPLRPDAEMDVYIFALFNENQKGNGSDDIEQNFGLFYPNMQKVYDFDFFHGARGGGDGGGGPKKAATSWCVANATAGDARLQAALEYACGHAADCSDIQSGAACFEPDTVLVHASHAFNSYYQRNHRGSGTCDFAGAAYVVYQEPRIGNCVLPSGA